MTFAFTVANSPGGISRRRSISCRGAISTISSSTKSSPGPSNAALPRGIAPNPFRRDVPNPAAPSPGGKSRARYSVLGPAPPWGLVDSSHEASSWFVDRACPRSELCGAKGPPFSLPGALVLACAPSLYQRSAWRAGCYSPALTLTALHFDLENITQILDRRCLATRKAVGVRFSAARACVSSSPSTMMSSIIFDGKATTDDRPKGQRSLVVYRFLGQNSLSKEQSPPVLPLSARCVFCGSPFSCSWASWRLNRQEERTDGPHEAAATAAFPNGQESALEDVFDWSWRPAFRSSERMMRMAASPRPASSLSSTNSASVWRPSRCTETVGRGHDGSPPVRPLWSCAGGTDRDPSHGFCANERVRQTLAEFVEESELAGLGDAAIRIILSELRKAGLQDQVEDVFQSTLLTVWKCCCRRGFVRAIRRSS